MERDRFPVVVHVLLIRDRRLFLLRRANTGYLDGCFALPGGHQHVGESVSAAAARECAEETGIGGAELVPVCVLPYAAAGQQGLNFVFQAIRWAGEPGNAEPELFDATGWYPLDALPEPRVDWIPEVLEMRDSGKWYREFTSL